MKWVKTYLTNQSQAVSINTDQSMLLHLPRGAPQESIPAPLLISLYINNFPSVLPEAETLMHTENTVLFMYGAIKADQVPATPTDNHIFVPAERSKS